MTQGFSYDLPFSHNTFVMDDDDDDIQQPYHKLDR